MHTTAKDLFEDYLNEIKKDDIKYHAMADLLLPRIKAKELSLHISDLIQLLLPSKDILGYKLYEELNQILGIAQDVASKRATPENIYYINSDTATKYGLKLNEKKQLL